MDQLFNVLLVALRTICFFVDNIVYGLIPILYKLLLYLARVDLVSDNVPVQALIQRIYILIGIFMLFRLSFSIMSYIVNPDAFSDQSKGFTNLVRRVMIVVVLLACIPWFFSKAYEIQGKILTSGILPRLVLGEAGSYKSSNNKSLETSIETSARDLQFLMFSPFFSLNYENADLNICDPGKSGNYSTSHLLGTNGMALSDNCLALMEEYFRTDSQLSASGVSLKDFFRTSNSGKDDKRKFKSFGSLVSWTLKDGEFAINYNPIISTLCGGYLVFLLLSFCIDVAARVIRLMFLQILSPIAVISSIDPTSAGDRLKEWTKECLKVWASLFLRLLVVFLIIQLVRVITDTIYSESFKVAGLSNGKGINIVIFVFLVLGVFQAAKSIPDLIEKATGIKMSGELQLNPFKALKENAGFVGLSGAALGAVGGAASGFVAGISTASANEHGPLRSTLSGIGALGSGGVTGFLRGGKAGGIKGWNSGLQSGGRIARRMDVREATGGIKGLGGMVVDRSRDIVGAPTSYESMENRAKRYDAVGEGIQKMKDRAVDQLGKKSNAMKALQAGKSRYDQAFREGGVLDAGAKQSAEKDLRGAYSRLQQSLANENVGTDKYNKIQSQMYNINKLLGEVSTSGQLTQESYVALQNEAYQQEQDLIARYIDSNGTDLGAGQTQGEDDLLALNRQSLNKDIKDSKLEVSEEELSSWRSLGADGAAVKTRAEKSALSIRADKRYNDARDRDQAIHSSRLDSHQKR